MARGRNVINQSIQLEGGDEIIALLKKMGAEGEQAAKKLENAFKKVEVGKGLAATFARLKTSFESLQTAGSRVAKSFGNVSNSLGNVGNAFRTATTRVGLFTTALTGAVAGSALFVKNSLDRVDDLGDLAASIGVTTTELQALQYAGAQAGVEGKDFVKVIASLTDSLAELKEAAPGTGIRSIGEGFETTTQNGIKVSKAIAGVAASAGDASKQFKELSPQAALLKKILKTTGLPVNAKLVPKEVLLAAADYFSQMQDGAQKTSEVITLFGAKLGPKLIPFLNQGGKAIGLYADKLLSLGALLSSDEINFAGRASDEITVLGFLFQQFSDKFAAKLAPSIIKASDAIFKAIEDNAGNIDKFLTDTATGIGTVIEDLVRLATGDEANIQNKWILDIRDGLVSAKTAAVDLFTNVLKPAFTAVREAAKPVADLINSIFGTNLTGDQVLIGAVLLQLVGGFQLLFSVIGLGINTVGLLFNALRLIGPLGKVIGGLGTLIVRGFTGLLTLVPRLALLLSPAGLIGLAIVGLGLLIYNFWDEIVAGAQEAFRFLTEVVSAGWEGIKAVSSAIFEGLKTYFSDLWSGLKEVAQAGLDGIKTAFSDTWEGMKAIATDARSGLVTVASDTWEGIKNTVAMARDGLFSAASDTWSAIKDAASSVATAVSPIWDSIVSGAQSAFSSVANLVVQAWSGASQTVVESAQAIQDAIARAADIAGDVAGAEQIAAQLVQPFLDAQNRIRDITASFGDLANSGLARVASEISSAAASIRSEINSIIAALQRAIYQAARLRASSGSTSGSTSGALGRAYGGYISGPGTSTSDSIPAWLSNGEFVIRAAAVRRYGAQLFSALNGMRLSPSAIGRYAMGGLVGLPTLPLAALPAAASGGPSSSLTLVLDNQSFGGLTGPAETIERLEKAIKMKRIRSTGRASPYSRGAL